MPEYHKSIHGGAYYSDRRYQCPSCKTVTKGAYLKKEGDIISCRSCKATEAEIGKFSEFGECELNKINKETFPYMEHIIAISRFDDDETAFGRWFTLYDMKEANLQEGSIHQCPFCKGDKFNVIRINHYMQSKKPKEKEVKQINGETFHVWCLTCEAVGPWKASSIEEAVTNWNGGYDVNT